MVPIDRHLKKGHFSFGEFAKILYFLLSLDVLYRVHPKSA